MVSYKQYGINLVVANIIITLVWIVLSISVAKNLEDNNRLFLVSALSVLSLVNILGAYFGITGIIRRYTCELTTYYILSRIAIVSESFVYLLILFAGKQSGSYHPVISSIQTGVTILVIITQIWLLYETKNFENGIKLEDSDDFDIFRVRRVSSPPDITDIEKNCRIYNLTDQLLVNPLPTYLNERRDSQLHNQLSVNPTIGSVYQPLSTPLMDDMPQSFPNHWYYPTGVPPPYKPF